MNRYAHLDDRLPTFVQLPTGCWLWLRSCTSEGYASWKQRGPDRDRAGHRVIYETLHGPVPPGMELDHRCQLEGCVNPGHLEPVPAQVNRHRRNLANGWRGAALIGLFWILSTAPGCNPAALRLWDAYITGPDTANYSAGWRDLPPTQTSFELAPYKPHTGCAIAWRFPVAIDAAGAALPDSCQPSGFSTSEGSWPGI